MKARITVYVVIIVMLIASIAIGHGFRTFNPETQYWRLVYADVERQEIQEPMSAPIQNSIGTYEHQLAYETDQAETPEQDGETDTQEPLNVSKVTETVNINGYRVKTLGLFEITAYCLCIICTGIWSHEHPRNADNEHFTQRTSSGTIPTAGRTVAVDSDVFPLGTRLYIQGLGWRVAEDTGGAVCSNVIDIFVDTHYEAVHWGRREREVFIWQG